MQTHVEHFEPDQNDKKTKEWIKKLQNGSVELKDIPLDEQTSEIYLVAVTQNGIALRYINKDKQTEELCLAAVTQNFTALRYVSINNQTEKICLAAITQDERALQYVNKDKLTEKICLAAVTKNGDALQYIRKDKQTEKICLAAVTKNGDTLQYVSKDKQTEEICLAAVTQNGYALKYVDKDKQTEEICLAAVTQFGYVLQYIDKDKQTEKICLAAVTQFGHALEYINRDKQTEKICRAAVTQNWEALKYIDKDKQTEELCLTAIKQNWEALKYIDKDKQTEELCLTAIKENWEALKYIDKDKQTEELCLTAIKQNWRALGYIDMDKQTEKICLAAVTQNWETLKYIDKDKQTQKICLTAVTQNWQALEYVNMDNQSEKICLAAVTQSWHALEYVHKEKQTETVCLAAISEDGRALQYIGEGNRTEKIYVAAAKNMSELSDFFKVIPKEKWLHFLKQDNLAEKLLRTHCHIPDIDDDQTKTYLESVQKEILSTCKTIILQPFADAHEENDTQSIYAKKHDEKSTLCIRDKTKLSALLNQLPKGVEVNMALIGHYSTVATKLAGMTPLDIAITAKNHPMIKKITLIGCNTGTSDELLPEEQQNIERVKTQKKDLIDDFKKTYPNIAFNKPISRPNALAQDILWGDGGRICGIAVMSKEESTPITLDVLKTKLDKALDAAYIILKKQDGNYAAYYLERGKHEIDATCIAQKLTPEQLNSLTSVSELTTVITVKEGGKLKSHPKHLMDSFNTKPIWCTSQKGKVLCMEKGNEMLKTISNILKHSRERSYYEVIDKGIEKPSVLTSTFIHANSQEFKTIEQSFAGQTVKALKDNRVDSVELVKAYRAPLYPDTVKNKLIATTTQDPFKGGAKAYNRRFFGTPQNILNIQEIKADHESRKQMKSIKIILETLPDDEHQVEEMLNNGQLKLTQLLLQTAIETKKSENKDIPKYLTDYLEMFNQAEKNLNHSLEELKKILSAPVKNINQQELLTQLNTLKKLHSDFNNCFSSPKFDKSIKRITKECLNITQEQENISGASLNPK